MGANITIIGVGLIGSSVGLALKRSKAISGLKIVGHDREPNASRASARRKAIDSVAWNVENAVKDADMVIVATPVMGIKEVMQDMAPHLPAGCVVTDTGSTKTDVLKWAEELLPGNVSFVGGHPLAGKEDSGPGAATADLFQGANYCIMPGTGASTEAVQTVVRMAEYIGAKPFFLGAQEHDSFVAAVSHLPIVLSSALVGATTASAAWHEISRVAASGYRDITRLASGDPEMNRDICLTNAKELGSWLDRVIGELLEIKRHLAEEDGKALGQYFANVYEEREKWLAGLVSGPNVGTSTELPSAGDRMGALFFGELMAAKTKALMSRYDDAENVKRKKRRFLG